MKTSLQRILAVGIIITSAHLHAQTTLHFSTLDSSAYIPIAKEILVEAYSRLGIKIVVVSFPSARAIELSNSGIFDGELTRIANIHKKYTNLIMIPTPYSSFDAVVFSKLISFKVNGWESLKPYRIVIQRGMKYAEEGTKGMSVQSLESYEHAMKFLKSGRADIAVAARLSGLEAINDSEIGWLNILSPAIVSYPIHHYLHKKHAGLVARLNNVLIDMHKEGIPQKVKQKKIDSYLNSKVIHN